MSERNDPLDLFAAARPHDAPLDPNVDVAAEAMLQQILATPVDPGALGRNRRGRRRGRRVVALSLVAVTLSAGTVAAVVVLRDKPSELTSLNCWSDGSRRPTEVAVVAWSGSDPVVGCATLWRDNGFESLDTNEAPPLVGCISEGGAVAVMPGDESTCSQLGLLNYDGSTDADIDRTRSAIEKIEEAINGADCVSAADASRSVEQILSDNGLADWTVVAADVDGASTTCMSAGIDTQQRQVFIVPGADD